MTQVVLLGYGGPEEPEQVRPFLDRIVSGRRISSERYEQVLENYQRIGGASPFNELTRRQARALERELAARGTPLPVQTAFRFMPPFITQVAAQAHEQREQTIAVILAAHQSEASWQKYIDLFPDAQFTAPFYERPGFIDAHADRIREALRADCTDAAQTPLIFTAHSIPQVMASRSPYVAQIHASAELVAAQTGTPAWHVAYTSRTGSPCEPWLEPDVRDLIADLAAQGLREVVVDPIGFLCDHVEVLYDLDVAAAEVARQHGVRMKRARALNDHPRFIGVLADAVQACLA